MKSTIICSTYNQVKFLNLTLDSILNQNTVNFNLIIADDGSEEETKKLVESYISKAKFKITHLWHEDLGWRKSQIHNKAIDLAQTDHLIFIDGDCILAPCFVEDHQSIFKKYHENYVLMGRRVELGQVLTSQLSLENYKKFLFSTLSLPLLRSCMVNDSRCYLRKNSFRNPILRKLFKANNVQDLLGCNFSLNKKSMIQINGFNNDYERGEDGDIFIRLRNSNHKLIGMKYFAPMFHQFHPRDNYQYVDDNYEQILKLKDYTRCQNGLDFYGN